MFAIRDPKERVRSLASMADELDIKVGVKPHVYLRKTSDLLRMAVQYHEEHALEQAYVLYLKYVTLILKKLPKHPCFEVDIQHIPAHNEMYLKGKRYCNNILDHISTIKEQLLKRYELEERELQIAEEKKRRAEEQRNAEERERLANARVEDLNLRVEMEKERARQEELLWEQHREKVLREQRPAAPMAVSQLPSAPQVPSSHPVAEHVAERPLDQPTAVTTGPVAAPPTFDRSLKPSISKPVGPDGLRMIRVPGDLVPAFIGVAAPNTSRNVETCANLCGVLRQNELIVTHLLVPKQEGTSDSCQTLAEEEIFELLDQHKLITFGWIHTHPSQTAFLSSIDLHMQLAYQVLLPEAIAIVHSPKFNETGYFHLTPEYGLDFVGRCDKSGHHLHPSSPELFRQCSHCQLDGSLQTKIIDLRKP